MKSNFSSMIRLLVNLRKKFFKNKEYGKYIFTAIFEILLIIIGIYLGLQVNRIQENKRSETIEKLTLNEIKQGLERDLYDTKINIKLHKNAIESCELLLNHFKENKPLDDSLKIHFARALSYSKFLPSSGPYETLKSRGVNIIRNNELRIQITEYYDFRVTATKEWEEDFLSYHFLAKEFVSKNFDNTSIFKYELGMEDLESNIWMTNKVYKEMSPINYESLIINKHYLNILRTLYTSNNWILNLNHNNQKKMLEETISNIEIELKRFY